MGRGFGLAGAGVSLFVYSHLLCLVVYLILGWVGYQVHTNNQYDRIMCGQWSSWFEESESSKDMCFQSRSEGSLSRDTGSRLSN